MAGSSQLSSGRVTGDSTTTEIHAHVANDSDERSPIPSPEQSGQKGPPPVKPPFNTSSKLSPDTLHTGVSSTATATAAVTHEHSSPLSPPPNTSPEPSPQAPPAYKKVSNTPSPQASPASKRLSATPVPATPNRAADRAAAGNRVSTGSLATNTAISSKPPRLSDPSPSMPRQKTPARDKSSLPLKGGVAQRPGWQTSFRVPTPKPQVSGINPPCTQSPQSDTVGAISPVKPSLEPRARLASTLSHGSTDPMA
eukprot:gene74-12894_t